MPTGGIPGMPAGGFPGMPKIPGFSGFAASDTQEGTVNTNSNDAVAVADPGESVTVINDGGKTTTHRGGNGQGIPNFSQGGIPGMPTGGFPGMPKIPGFSGFAASDNKEGIPSNSANAVSNAGPGESVTTISKNIDGKQSTETTKKQI
ncbi:hypothetical protein BKA69DRAFT_1129860 [Paraphysoderma sedebokerense]|nr:hypothetical protein BKA69DRAFT_1129860 [Paraphysoderma sedebokerense]